MAQLTPSEWNKKLEAKLKQLQDGKIVELSAKTSQQEAVKRIFEDGKKSNGASIGSYDDQNELWVGSPPAPRATTRKGKTGKPIKTGYYASYKKFRAQQGREDKFVNLRLTNELQSDYANSPASETSIAQASPIRVNNFEYIVTLKKRINQEKREGLEAKYGTIFDLTKEEEKLFFDVLDKETRLILDA